jgi:predicted ribosomally synthesized peptide with SipW-like signal peptide
VKKLLFTVMACVLCIGLMGSAFAYFSDYETSTGNTFTAGTIDIDIDGANPCILPLGTLDDMKPCTVGYINFTINNVGANEVEVWKQLYDVVCDENGIIEPEQDWYDDENGGVAKNDIDTVILYDLTVDGTNVIEETDGLHISDVASYWIYLGTIAPGGHMDVEQSYHMEADTENWAQSDTMTFSIELFAQQTVGDPQPPPPGTELSGHGR